MSSSRIPWSACKSFLYIVLGQGCLALVHILPAQPTCTVVAPGVLGKQSLASCMVQQVACFFQSAARILCYSLLHAWVILLTTDAGHGMQAAQAYNNEPYFVGQQVYGTDKQNNLLTSFGYYPDFSKVSPTAAAATAHTGSHMPYVK